MAIATMARMWGLVARIGTTMFGILIGILVAGSPVTLFFFTHIS